jgi:DNA-binding NarL/FixJ family response regulator
MPPIAGSVSNSPRRVRIAITSPGILAQIRQVLASKNLAVEFAHQPYVEVTVKPTATGAAPRRRTAAPTSRQLVAEYQLNVVQVESVEPVPDAPALALSRRQSEVMELVCRGVRNPEIAARLGLSEKTVKNHINRIFSALGAASRVEAVLIWQQHQRAAANGSPLVAGLRPASWPPASAETP